MMKRVLAAAALLLTTATVAAAEPFTISIVGGTWLMRGPDRVQVWSNSPESRLAIDNRRHGNFTNMSVTWQNMVAGTFLSTPEGVVIGSSRDGSDLTSQLTVSPGDHQQWALHPNVNGPYKFSVIGDTRNTTASQRTYGQLSRDMAARQMLFSIHLGNAVTNGSVRQLELFREQLKSFSFPTYVVPGNHDVAGTGRKAWQRLFGAVPLSFKVARDRFLLIDNTSGVLDKSQLKWLEASLQQASGEQARHTFVFLHQPLVDTRPGLNQGMRDVAQVRSLLRLFQRYHVHTVFAGHIPMYAQEQRRGVRYVTTGGGGDKLASHAARGAYHHYIKVEVDGDTVNIAAVPL